MATQPRDRRENMSHRWITIIGTILSLLLLSQCAKKVTLPWSARVISPRKATFDSEKGEVVASLDGILVRFTPVPKLIPGETESYGHIIIRNNTDKDIVVLWEMASLSDSYGFTKKFRLGQKKRLKVKIPHENSVITPGSEMRFDFSTTEAELEEAKEYMDFATYILTLPVKSDSKLIELSIEYSINKGEGKVP